MTSLQRWTHRLAIAVVVVALLPIAMGALTTTLGAGMAFLDWPTSDGENMLLYNMLRDIRLGKTDKVAEHGHRLSGVVIGILSIALAMTGWRDRRPGVRATTILVLLGVVGQGLLGGIRVRLDSTALAMGHGLFGAIVFALMGLTALVTSRRWSSHTADLATGPQSIETRPSTALFALACLVPVLIIAQYLLGGFVRHFGWALYEHLGGAVLVTVAALTLAMVAVQSGVRFLRPFAWGVFATVLVQVLLGFGAWATKYGIGSLGIVAVERSAGQVILRSGHTIGGMLLMMAAVLLAAAVFRTRFSPWPASARLDLTPALAAWNNKDSQQTRGLVSTGGAR